ncbi:uncharacterized protein LOC115944543 isoform X2 [Leptonychotes weddellii]|uniref:Uncharacterized protein LOC115944543 isoform X2 n=1 Tax=Leptonychotes weddellii TaxID=9713 RepID=A0A7F8RSC1_LEPWE|nr:uncharacterized protein LOC115944543 isoform X2 [Leptonychotes weddellii]
MDQVKRKGCCGKKKPRLKGKAGSEHQQILPSEAQGHPRQQPKGHPPKPRRKIAKFLGVFHRNKEPQNVVHLTETSKGFFELVQEGQFLEAYQSISTLAEEGQDCGPQYQAVAQSMWQVVQQALEGTGPSQELELKLQAVLTTVGWTQDKHQSREAGALQDGGVAPWAGQLEKLLRNDAEARVPTLGPKDQPDPYLEKLDKAVRQGLGSSRASRLGTCLWGFYRTYFQEVLLSRLSELTRSCGTNLKSSQVLYTWGKTNLFGRPGETLAKAPLTSQQPTVGHLLDPVMFVTWMSQMQKKLVGLIQLLEESMNAVQPMGLPITSQVQAMVLETFSEFLKRYQAEAVHFLQQNAAAGAFPEVHVLANCCILRETWRELSQEHVQLPALGPAVQGTIHVIEDHGRDHLLPRVRTLCQSQLRDHFRKKDKDLVRALQCLWQGLEGCPNMHSTPVYEEPIMGIFESSENKSRETVDDWLASFRDRFPGYLSMQDQPCCSVDLEEEIEVKGSSCRCC